MLNELDDLSRVMSLEAFCGDVSLENAFAKLPGYIGQLRTFFTDKIGGPLKLNFTGTNNFTFNKAVQKTTYTDFKNVTLFVPQGLTVPYLQYQSVLEDATACTLKMEESVLDPLIKWLGERLGNPASLSSVSSALKVPGYNAQNIEAIEKAIQKSFVSTGQKQSEVAYPSVIKRQGDWTEITSGIESMELRMSEDFHKRIVEKMHRLDDLLATLVRRIEETPTVYSVSPQTLSDLATVSFSAARHLEFYGLTKYRLEEYSTAVRDSIKKLEVFVK